VGPAGRPHRQAAIGIFTRADDPHADVVASLLSEREIRFVRLDPGALPAHAMVSARFSSGQFASSFATDGRVVDLTSLAVVWWRRPSPPTADGRLDEQTARSVREESAVVLADLWAALPCAWVPTSPAALGARHKISHLVLAQAVGFELPSTVVTNDPHELLELYRETEGALISKRAGSSFLSGRDSPFCRYTEVVSPRDIGYARAARYSPTIFQAYVPKRSEIRVTVVGKRIFAVEIDSQASNHSRHDWRRYDYLQTPYRPHDLPLEVEARCLELLRRLDLCFGAIDLILTPDDEYVFVELNPNGQYLWLEEATGLPISDAVCDLLVELAGGGSSPDSSTA
jgi:glutathione synthase/RimK-type ligase-like ATP-grasp enzyme